MKKLLMLPAFVLFITGASSTNIETQASRHTLKQSAEPITVKLDSVNIKAMQLEQLIKQL